MKTLSSYHQQRMWFIDHFEKDDLYVGGPIYHNIPSYFTVNKAINENAIQSALVKLMECHSILRTRLSAEEDQIFQVIDDTQVIDTSLIIQERSNLEKEIEELRQVSFEFDKEILFKVYYKVAPEKTCFLFVFHHAVVDRHSLNILKEDFLKALHTPDNTLETATQYVNFSNWQNSLSDDDLESLTFYWKTKLKDLQVLYFPTDTQREQVHIYKANHKKLTLDKNKISSFCDKEGLSPNSLFLAVYKMALARLTGLSDIVIGTLMNLRSDNTSNLVGPIENLVVLRSMVSTDQELLKLCSVIDQTYQEAKEYNTMPFDKLVREINPKKDMSRTALFDILYVYDQYDNKTSKNTLNDSNQGWGKYDFNLLVKEYQTEYSVTLTYNELYFNSNTVCALLGLIKRLLFSILDEKQEFLKDVELVSETEKQQLIAHEFSTFKKENNTIVSQFLAQVQKHSTKKAVSWSGGSMNYSELDNKSNQIAQVLTHKLGVEKNNRVAVVLDKTEAVVSILLAILKCGATYIPINPDYPEERKAFICEDTSCKVIIDDAFIATYSQEIEASRKEALETTVTQDDQAYIIYTSGTTGQPKGVMVTHGNVMSLLDSCDEHFDFSKDDSWTFFHSYCFDFSVWEIFGCLLSGGNLVIVCEDEARNPDALTTLMNANTVTVFSQTPSSFYNFIGLEKEVPSLRYVIFGGEALNPSKLKGWSENHPDVRLINMYGITETTVHVTYKEVTSETLASPLSNIGKPLAFAKCYILDKEQHLLPFGRIGELYVAGEGVTDGYLNRATLNAERFINNPFSNQGKMYRTGDLARFLPNGELEYLGRIDDQVKIRGYRIELDEIKKQLDTLDGINQSVVTLITMPDGDKSIVAYVSISEELTVPDVKAYISSKVPEYMVPTFITQVSEIPMNANGKIDKSNLPSPLDDLSNNLQEIVAPSNDIENKLFSIWQELLNTDKFGVHHNFFELGGHSLKATRLIGDIHKAFQVKLELKQLFSNPTLIEQAKLIASSEKKEYISIKKAEDGIHFPISDAQRRLLMLSQIAESSVAYNMPSYMTVEGDSKDIDSLKKAIYSVINRHEILRTIFKENDKGEFRQWILPENDPRFGIDIIDLREKENKYDLVKSYITSDSHKRFDMEQGPLIRSCLMQISNDKFIFYYNVHHIISDGWSQGVLAEDVLTYYEAYRNNEEPNLSELNIQYKDYTVWQQKQIKGDDYQLHRSYWMDRFANEIPILELSISKDRPNIKTYDGAVIEKEISPTIFNKFQNLTSKTNTTTYMNLLCVTSMLLYRYSFQKDIVIGSPAAGRIHPELENQIGFYVNTLPHRILLDTNQTYLDFLATTKRKVLESFEHETYPFDVLIEELKQGKDLSRSPLFDIMLIVNDQTKQTGESSKEIKEINNDQANRIRSKYDISFNFNLKEDKINCHFIYNTNLFEKSDINNLANDFLILLESIINDDSLNIEEYVNEILDKEELLEQDSFLTNMMVAMNDDF